MIKMTDVNYLKGLARKYKRSKPKKKNYPTNVIRSCGGCRAYQDDKCVLKYDIQITLQTPLITMHKPVNKKCPKPLSWKDFDAEVLKRKGMSKSDIQSMNLRMKYKGGK